MAGAAVAGWLLALINAVPGRMAFRLRLFTMTWFDFIGYLRKKRISPSTASSTIPTTSIRLTPPTDPEADSPTPVPLALDAALPSAALLVAVDGSVFVGVTVVVLIGDAPGELKINVVSAFVVGFTANESERLSEIGML